MPILELYSYLMILLYKVDSRFSDALIHRKQNAISLSLLYKYVLFCNFRVPCMELMFSVDEECKIVVLWSSFYDLERSRASRELPLQQLLACFVHSFEYHQTNIFY